MTIVLLASVVAAALTLYVYVGRERLWPAGVALAALRWFGVTLLVLLAVNPAWQGRPRTGPPVVLLDRSLSMVAEGGAWERALDTARTLAGSDGQVLGFGRTVGSIGDTDPQDGATLLEPALRAARGFDGAVYVVTDGEVRDAALLRPSLLANVHLVVVPRTPIPGAALSRVVAPGTVASGDSIPVRTEITTWGSLDADSARVEILTDDRRLAVQTVSLPPAPATVSRDLLLPSAALGAGEHVLTVQVLVDGDAEHRDNVRVRIVSVADDPPALLVADPATRDARALYETLTAVSGMPLRGITRIAADRWIDMATARAVTEGEVRRVISGAALLVICGSADRAGRPASPVPTWWWRQEPAGMIEGDWYVVSRLDPSPLAGLLAQVQWDSVPPLTGLWMADSLEGVVALGVQLARRGTPRPLVVIADGADRRLETLGSGFSRWVLRGGASAEAFRTLVAAGTDWLLQSGQADRPTVLRAARSVQRGLPVTFRWVDDSIPDSVMVRLSSGTDERDVVLHFAADGTAETLLSDGIYRWTTGQPGLTGRFVVEAYSDEFVPSPVVLPEPMGGAVPPSRAVSYLRERWWVFLLAIGALVIEWAWRQRGGLP